MFITIFNIPLDISRLAQMNIHVYCLHHKEIAGAKMTMNVAVRVDLCTRVTTNILHVSQMEQFPHNTLDSTLE